MLLLENYPERRNLKKYFYSDRPWLTLSFWVGLSTIGLGIGFILLLIWAIFKIYFMFFGNKADERLYDEILDKDIEYLKKRSVETMGVIEDEYSLIDPVVGISFASEASVKTGIELTADKRNIFKMIYESMVSLARAAIRFLRLVV